MPTNARKGNVMTDFITQTAEQYLSAIAKVQDAYVDALEQFSKRLPETPAVPAITLPGPSARELSDVAYDIAEKALAQQKALTEKLFALAS
jgi:hypothetical protein